MKNDLTLVIMAAGKGSRYGGSKQTDRLGLCGESIMDFSIFDAMLAGFNHIVFIIQENQRDFFEMKYKELSKKCHIEMAIQEGSNVPFDLNGFQRLKPWGTTHALWSAKSHIHTPFCVLNADDYYGRSTFEKIANFLINNDDPKKGVFVAYELIKTMSSHGSVSRGVCTIQEGKLKKIKEELSIEIIADTVVADNRKINPQTPVSMNIWGLHPYALTLLEQRLVDFAHHLTDADRAKKEALLPMDIQSCIDQNLLSIVAVYADEAWFGITYQQDKEVASSKLRKLQSDGYYPSPLF
jgi:NDP-sugar pyrophosphorylase family protein